MRKNRSVIPVVVWLFSVMPNAVVAMDVHADERSVMQGSEGKTSELVDEGAEWFFTGRAMEEYRFRRATDLVLDDGLETPKAENDHDLRLVLSGNIWESTDRFSADIAMSVWYDLDGGPKPGQPTSFGSISDYRAPNAWDSYLDVYSLNAEYSPAALPLVIRAGRQTPEIGRRLTFDGLSAAWRPRVPSVDLQLSGGRTVHFFELSDNYFEDWMASAAAVIRFIPSFRIEMDYLFTSEMTTSNKRFVGHDAGITAAYRFRDLLFLKAFVRSLNGDLSRAGGRGKLELHKIGFGVEAGAESQPLTLREVNEADDPYFAIMGESLPYIRTNASVWKDFDTRAGIYGFRVGWNERRLLRDASTPFNRNFGRVYLELHAFDIGTKGPFITAVAEYHYALEDDPQNEENQFSVGGSAGYRGDKLDALIGTNFYKYKYDYYSDVEERSNVRVYFGEAKYKILKWLSAGVRYELERFDRDLHTLTVQLTQTY